MVFPDDPQPISVDFLKKLDAAPPGTYFGQPKKDGWRRLIHFDAGKWTAQAKRGSEGSARPLPEELSSYLDGLAQNECLQGVTWDSELMGTRMVEHGRAKTLQVFDILRQEGRWLREVSFRARQDRLMLLWDELKWPLRAGVLPEMSQTWTDAPVQLVPTFSNPGLVDLFQQQMQDALSEGLVVRRADSTLILDLKKCTINALILKIKYRNIREKVIP